MPDFSFKTLGGDSLNLASFRNKKNVLICFWSSWCGPCIKNIPFLKKIEKEYKDKGLQLLSVSIDDERKQVAGSGRETHHAVVANCDLPGYVKDVYLRSLYQIHVYSSIFLNQQRRETSLSQYFK
jgi:thiol-disulfide isomerase/thioredoxin